MRLILFRGVVVICSLLILAACGNPYALDINKLNLGAKQKYGLIQFSDPKLFPREHLINERHNELNFLGTALEKCKEGGIQPEVIRELEVVRALAVGVRLESDPVAARNFKSNAEIVALQNDIARTRLEMQLAQLRRDAELLKDQLEAQIAPVSELGIGNEPPAAKPVSGSVTKPTVEEVNNLLGKLDDLVNALQSDARADIDALTKKGGEAGPIDTFNYQKACRDTVKNVINQTRLDDLHDMDGNALFRLQIRATVLPGDTGYDDTLGILRMEVKSPTFNTNSLLSGQVYRRWLEYVNHNINLPPDENVEQWKDRRIRTAPRFSNLRQYFELRYLEVPKIGPEGMPLNMTSQRSCMGLQNEERWPDECWYLRIALPPGSADRLDILTQASDKVIDMLRGAAKGIWTSELHQVTASKQEFEKNCDVQLLDDDRKFLRLQDRDRFGMTAQQAVELAVFVNTSWPTLLSVLRALSDSFESKAHGDAIRISVQQAIGDKTFILGSAVNEVLSAVGAKFPNCQQERFLSLLTPPEFVQAIRDSVQRVAVYDVAPAERVQPVSTAARAVEALALAASIAGSLPESGLGARNNLAFSRSAVGKVDAIELAPIVVGFTEPVYTKPDDDDGSTKSNSSFGWLLGPKAVIKAKEQELAFQHPIKPYELYADLSLPGWWPEFQLKTYTAWAPNWRRTDSTATMDTTVSGEKLERIVKIPMRTNAGDMDGLTTVLLKAASVPLLGAPQILRVEPEEVSPCDGQVEFQIWGHNVWRASLVHLGGRAIDRDQVKESSSTTAIKVLPDMRGILASIDLSANPIRRDKKEGTTITVWTPDGRDTAKIRFSDVLQADGECKESPEGGPPQKPGAPTISVLRPGRVSACAGTVKFRLLGTNLSADAQINVGGAAATGITMLPSEKGLSFDLNVADIAAIENQVAMVMVSTEGGDTSGTLAFSDVRTVENTCVSARVLTQPTISELRPARVSACAGTVKFQLLGTNLSADAQISVGGAAATEIAVLPSEKGLSFDLNVADIAAIEDETATVSVLTEGGDASVPLAFSDVRTVENTCVSARVLTQPTISELRPARVSACAGTVKFQLLGTNLSADAQISVGGAAATEIAVLPSEKGLSFDLNVADIAAIEDETATVSVLTEGGDASVPLAFSDVRAGDNSCKTAEEFKKPTIREIVPNQISICAPKATLTAQGTNLGTPLEARLGGVVAFQVEELSPRDGTLVRFEVDLEASRKNFVGLANTSAEIRNADGLTAIEVALVGDPTKCD